ncbi:MFS transporter [Conexibacter stalactiti]|uniref:MFS transporter n=1 Tax=Conexibacter stalactiti TaxID=1940611 RepID=A0ABU4HJJ4_9ACTN|nr:MFS transporter [Conexibacter stalactiti]MDW5592730.1 MFS transporter [Conexibacter stalactiti]MEC5033371.1 MFS transporter [Conexibacter stalactiti]
MPAHRRRILISMCLALATVVSAVASLNVALPDLARATGATPTQLQWIVDGYALVFAGLLLPAGALGDRLGRRRVLLAGLAVFGGAALVAIFVTDPGQLIAARVAMGLGAALIMPTTLSIITSVFPTDERERAVAAWAGVAGGSGLLGLLVSGVLLEWFDWSSVFATNVVLAVLAATATLINVRDAETHERPALDPVGAALSALGLSALVWGVIEGPQRGWTDGLVLGGFAGGALLLSAFVSWELRREQPMLDPRLFALRGFAAGSLSIFVQFFALFGFMFVVMQYLQFVLGYTPLEAGFALAPVAVVMIGLSQRVPALVHRFGARAVAPTGLATMAAGFALLATAGAEASYWRLLVGLLVLAIGMALATTPATSAIVDALPAEKQGVASAVNDASREVGGALGIAVLGSVLTEGATRADGVTAALLTGAGVLLLGAVAVALRAPSAQRRGAYASRSGSGRSSPTGAQPSGPGA